MKATQTEIEEIDEPETESAPEEVTAEEPPRMQEPHYLCKSHHLHFPKEDPLRPMHEYTIDPMTLEKLRTYCKRCDNANKAMYAARKKADRMRPALDRVHDEQVKQQAKLDGLVARDEGDSQAAAEVRFVLNRLEVHERALQESAGPQQLWTQKEGQA